MPAAGRQPQGQKRAISGMAGWVRWQGTAQVRPCSLGRAIHGAHALPPDPPRLRRFPASCRNDILLWWVSTLVDTADVMNV
ncbi:hypothetical protein B9Y61_16995 [Stenotrophomonas maltophilia]|nr:hypothetical protein B9Y61_16995 [Stenotrophomonas maltophilia]